MISYVFNILLLLWLLFLSQSKGFNEHLPFSKEPNKWFGKDLNIT